MAVVDIPEERDRVTQRRHDGAEVAAAEGPARPARVPREVAQGTLMDIAADAGHEAADRIAACRLLLE